MKNALRLFSFLTLLTLIFSPLGVTPASAAGVDLSNNLSQPFSDQALVDKTNWHTQGFATDATHTQITTVSLPLCKEVGVTGSYEVQIWTATGAGATPGSRVADVAASAPTSVLSTCVLSGASPTVTFSSLAIDLSPSTTYYLLVSGVGITGTGFVKWDYTSTTSGTGFPSNYTSTINGGVNWELVNLTDPQKMQIVADAPATAATTTVLTSSPNPSTFGQSVTFTATVAPVPSGGTVAFKDGGTTISGCGTQAINGSGQATCATSTLTVGSHPITAVYSGNASYAASISAGLTQTVNPDINDFVITVKTDNAGTSSSTQFTIPTDGISTYNYNVDCNNDGTNEAAARTGKTIPAITAQQA